MTGFWRSLLTTIARNPISFFAVICVACTAAFLGYMSWRMLTVLESPGWCGKAIQAERISPGSTYVGLTTCVDLLKEQLSAVAGGFRDGIRIFGLVLLTLVIVVVAGAKAKFKAGSDGIEADISRDAAAGAQQVAQAAVDEADTVAHDGPSMPEPRL